MQAKKSLMLGWFLAFSFAAITGGRPAVRADAEASAAANAGRAVVLERAYKLPRAQAEVLALLLRLDMPRDTSVKTDSKNASRIIISGPQAVHDGVAPLVNLLVNEQASRHEARAATSKERMIEMEKNFRQSEADMEAERLRRRPR